MVFNQIGGKDSALSHPRSPPERAGNHFLPTQRHVSNHR